MLTLRKHLDGRVTIEGEAPAQHHFGTKLVTRALVEGTLSVTGGRIVLHLADGDLAYRIVRGPGAYCRGCGAKVGDGPARTREQVEARRSAATDCCAGDRDDVEVIDFYDTEKEG